jgi:hypothetical protein
VHMRPMCMCVAALCVAVELFKILKDRKSVSFGVWAAPGAPETLPKGGGRSPPPFGRASRALGAAQTPKDGRCPILKKLKKQPISPIRPLLAAIRALLGPYWPLLKKQPRAADSSDQSKVHPR